ncbi:uncharacterized protein V1516DRAFT_674557 [Lipomyces oligophaga]|uniref:uncharacterized protein n=1 Tax=Lipomyces oligophaga TaxID=45792 RepID=UPI0034CDF325
MELTLQFGEGPKQLHRVRKVRTCRACTSRRVKCSRERPTCSQCLARNVPCEYQEDGSENLNGKIENIQESNESATTVATNQPKRKFENAFGRQQKDEDGHQQQREGPQVLGDLLVNSETGAARFCTIFHWPTIFPRYSNVFYDSSQQLENSPIDARDKFVRMYMPDRATCDDLIDCYFRCMHPIVPLCSKTDFYPFYERFWRELEAPDSGAYRKQDTFFTVVFAMLYGATVGRNAQLRYLLRRDQNRILAEDPLEANLKTYRSLADSALQVADFLGSPTIFSLWAAQLVFITQYSEPSTARAATLAMLIRISQSMGLHWDPSMFSQKLPDWQVRLRRNLWWTFRYLDGLVSFGSGIPVTMLSSAYTVKDPQIEGMLDEDALFVIGRNGITKFILQLSSIFDDFINARVSDENVVEYMLLKMDQTRIGMRRDAKLISTLSFSELSPRADMDYLRTVQKVLTATMAVVSEKTYLMVIHIAYALKRIHAREKRHSSVESSADESVSVGTSSADQIVFNAVLSSMKVVKLLNMLIKDLDRNSDCLWHLLLIPQFHSLMIIYRDVCARPTRNIAVEFDEIMQRVGFRLSDFRAAGEDERLEISEQMITVIEMLRLDEDRNGNMVVEYSRLLKLRELAKEAKKTGVAIDLASSSSTPITEPPADSEVDEANVAFGNLFDSSILASEPDATLLNYDSIGAQSDPMSVPLTVPLPNGQLLNANTLFHQIPNGLESAFLSGFGELESLLGLSFNSYV